MLQYHSWFIWVFVQLQFQMYIEKAFDSISWQFLYKLLQVYGFPTTFIDWIKVMHNGKELRVFNNGHSSDHIQVNNGLAQGCTLSPFLFIFCMEALARVIRDNKGIEGIPIENMEKKIGLIADETLLVTKASRSSLKELESAVRI